MNTTRTLVRSSTHAFAASLVGVTIGLAASIVTARALGPDGKGAYDLVLSTAMLLALVLGLSMPSGITFSVARHTSATRPLVGWVLVLGIAQGVAAGVVLAALANTGLADQVGRAATDSALRIVVPSLVAVLCIGSSLKAILIGRQRVALASWLDILSRAITIPMLILVAIGAIGGVPTVNHFVLATLIGGTLGTILILRAVLHVDIPHGGGAGLRTVIRFSTPAYAANVLQYLNYRLDLFLLAYFRDLREVGLYALAASLAQLVWLVSGAVATAVFAHVGSASDDPHEAASRTAALSRSVLIIQVGLAGALRSIAQPVLRILYGDSFVPAASPLWLLLPGVVALGAATVVSAHIAGLGYPALNLVGAVVGLSVTLALDVLLIPSVGMNGAAIASTASYASTALSTTFFFFRLTGLPATATFAVRTSDFNRLLSGLRSVIR